MSYIIKKKENFFWKIKLKTPSKDGVFDEQSVWFEFKKLNRTETIKVLEDKTKKDIDVLLDIIVNWKDVVTEENTEIKFSKESLKEYFLDDFGYPKQIIEQYLSAISGAAQEKN